MEKEYLDEIVKSLEMAKAGYWQPTAIIGGAFAIVIAVLLAYWRRSEKYNDKRHNDSEELIKQQVGLSQQLGEIVAIHKEKHTSHERRFDKLEA